jgi:hypothetical protein
MTTKAEQWASDRREKIDAIASQERPSFKFPGAHPMGLVPGLSIADGGNMHLEPPRSVVKMHKSFVLEMIAWLTEWYGPAEVIPSPPELPTLEEIREATAAAQEEFISQQPDPVGDPRDDMPVDIHAPSVEDGSCSNCNGSGCVCCDARLHRAMKDGCAPKVELGKTPEPLRLADSPVCLVCGKPKTECGSST